MLAGIFKMVEVIVDLSGVTAGDLGIVQTVFDSILNFLG